MQGRSWPLGRFLASSTRLYTASNHSSGRCSGYACSSCQAAVAVGHSSNNTVTSTPLMVKLDEVICMLNGLAGDSIFINGR